MNNQIKSIPINNSPPEVMLKPKFNITFAQ